MTAQSANQRTLTNIIASVALGAVAMYVLDPDKGRRRRAVGRDKARRMVSDTRDMISTAGRDMRSRVQGMKARMRQLMRRGEVPEDLVLIERVRTKIGRACSHPHAIQVGANHGRVTLSGPVLADEAQGLLDAARATWGVTQVDDKLVVHEHPELVSSLQGGVPRRERRFELLQENWTPSLRVAAVVGGSLFALAGSRQRGPMCVALTGLGIWLAVRGTTNMPLTRLAGTVRGRRAIDLHKTIHIDAAPEEVYDLWTDCASFPQFMSHVEEVRELGNGRTHWVLKGAAGARVEWDTVTTQAIRPQRLSWRSEPNSLVQHAGSVYFEPADGGTRVTVKMTYNPLGGFGHALASLLGSNPKRQMSDDLARMKVYIEHGVPRRDAAAPVKTPGPALH